MGTYLEDYLENIYMLPSEIKRNFDLMRELDQTSYPLIEELQASHKEYLINARQKITERCNAKGLDCPDEAELRELIEADTALETLRSKHQLIIQKLDEKIAIAAQSYELVDHHIQRLDDDLVRYAELLKQNGEFEDEKVPKKQKKHHHTKDSHIQPLLTPLKQNIGSATTPAPSLTRKRSIVDTSLTAHQLPAVANVPIEDLPVDPNEPVYCHCRRVSYGEMVGCDNEDCPYEWFHFECVGLTSQPSGKWYCKDCKPHMMD